jgi:cytosine deaminase
VLLVRRARIPVALLPASFASASVDPLEPAVLCDLTLTGARLTDVVVSSAAPAPANAREFDVAGSLVFPGFVDAHVHLDKTHTWHRAPNRSGTFRDALTTLCADRVNWSETDLHRRAGFALRTAWAHGTRAIRTHIDSDIPSAETSYAVMSALRAEWRDRIDLQLVPVCGGDIYGKAAGEKMTDLALRHGASALGGFFQMSAALPAQLDRLLAVARERGVGLDLHVDENGDPQSECLRLVAEAVLRTEFPHPIVCGHCCSLAVQDPARARSTIDLVRAARLGVISLSLCNLYLQDRRAATAFPRSPSWRGLAPINDLLDAGVPVACASDNVRDAFHAFGDYDASEVYSQSLRLAHLDTRLADSVRVVTSTAADLIGRPDLGRIAVGAPAHLVIFPAQRFSEFLSRPAAARRCIHGEEIFSPLAPDFAELGEPVA